MIFMHNPELADCIGGESCVDLKPAEDYAVSSGGGGRGGERRGRRKEGAVEREFPPRISSLARAENLLAPWVMRKYYTSDGRLVIKEEKVKRHEYFRAHRSNGRLVMSLVPVEGDDDYGDEECGDGGEEAFDDCVGNAAITGEGIDGGDGERIRNPTVEDGFSEHCKYNRMGVSPCGGGLAVPLAVGGGGLRT